MESSYNESMLDFDLSYLDYKNEVINIFLKIIGYVLLNNILPVAYCLYQFMMIVSYVTSMHLYFKK